MQCRRRHRIDPSTYSAYGRPFRNNGSDGTGGSGDQVDAWMRWLNQGRACRDSGTHGPALSAAAARPRRERPARR